MGQKQLLSVAEIGLNKDALVVAVLINKVRDEQPSTNFVSLEEVARHSKRDLVPNVHEFFEFVGSYIFEVEFSHFLVHDLLDELLLT